MDVEVFAETSFDEIAKYYDIDYPEIADQDFLRQLASGPGVDSILEVPCGSGRNLAVLNESGARIVAVDRSPDMIEQVKAKVAASHGKLNVTPVCADLCALRLEEKFSLIVVPREAFQLIVPWEEATAALESLAFHLRSNGTLLIDIAHFVDDPSATPGIQPDYYSPTLADGEVLSDWERRAQNGDWVTRSRAQFHVSPELYRTTFYYKIRDDAGMTSFRQLHLEFRKYSLEGLVEYAARYGLRLVECYSDYQSRPPYANAARTVALFTRV